MTDLKWMNNVNVEMFSEEAQVLYSEYKDLQRKAAEARAAFEYKVNDELWLSAALPLDKQMVFNYKFGNISMAVGEKREDRKVKIVPKKQTLAEWLAQNS